MQKTATKAKSSSSYTRPALQKSTTLSRKYVRRPGAVKQVDGVKKVAKKDAPKKIAVQTKSVEKPVARVAVRERSAKIQRFNEHSTKKVTIKVSDEVKVSSAKVKKPAVKTAGSTAKTVKPSAKTIRPKVKAVRPSARTIKPSAKARADKEADKARAAIQNVATMGSVKPMKKRGKGRILLAFTCSAIVVAALGVFVAINMPNISVKVAAIQTGIDAEYPDFVPRNYSMETVAADKDGKITMKFVGPNESSFTLIEEKSTWDSTAVLNNFVKENYSANYSTMHEQGITYYSDAGSAAWVNGGVLYKITSYGKNLSREQIRNLVVSL